MLILFQRQSNTSTDIPTKIPTNKNIVWLPNCEDTIPQVMGKIILANDPADPNQPKREPCLLVLAPTILEKIPITAVCPMG
mmetsp:Transcript_4194/g.5409  ORF Transcript_4194/g.5409 Transcript_4194/m.5409 type:complete len:81 (-) Transcript_4194:1367-1609(-)